MELAGRYALNLGCHSAVDAQIAKGSSHQAACKSHKLWCVLELLGGRRDTGEESECFVLNHIHAVVVGPQVIHLFLVDQCPEVGAYKLHGL